MSQSLTEVVETGYCIGCGLCEALGANKVSMQYTALGSLRPHGLEYLNEAQQSRLLAACPGVSASSKQTSGVGFSVDMIWGQYADMRYAWAGDDEVRYKAATGGVLTALGQFLLSSHQVDFILQVAADPAAPMRNRWVISETPEQVLNATASRYSPTAPLAGLEIALAREQSFAIIAKPCDLNALHNLSLVDSRIDRYCLYRLALVCGGQSRLSKSEATLKSLGLNEQQVRIFRHRGHGNPGATYIETKDDQRYELSYSDLWGDESGWDLETRCKFCPDALGEAADIVAADVWPGGSPSGEDAGFNGIVVRSACGQALLSAAHKAEVLELGEAITPAQFNEFQPHQVRKKQALVPRMAAMLDSGYAVIKTQGLRLFELVEGMSSEHYEREYQGTRSRAKNGKFKEPL